jgi:hypothetical protein
MADTVSSLLILLKANIADYSKKLNTATKQMVSFGDKLGRVGRSMSLKVSAPIALVSAVVLKLGLDAVESENLFEVSFGKMADSARTWSEELADSLGLNEFALRNQSAQLFTMFESMGLATSQAFEMSTAMTELSLDMASFFDLPTADAFEKLRAGITGEVEPLKRLGIIVSDQVIKQAALTSGIIDQKRELTEIEKVQSRWNVILRATQKAQGDLARTMDSPTNRLRAFKEQMKEAGIQIGQTIIQTEGFMKAMEGMDRIAGFAQRAAEWFSKLSPELQSNIIQMVALAAATGPVLTVLSDLVIALAGVVIGFAGAKIVYVKVAAAVIALDVALIALVASVGIFALSWSQNWGNIRGQLVTAQTAIIASFKAIGDAAWELLAFFSDIGSVLWDALWGEEAMDVSFKRMVDSFHKRLDTLVSGFKNVGVQTREEWKFQTDYYREQLNDQTKLAEMATEAIRQYRRDLADSNIAAIDEELQKEREALAAKVTEIRAGLQTEAEEYQASYDRRREILERAIAIEVDNRGDAIEALKRLDSEYETWSREQALETAETKKSAYMDALDAYEDTVFRMQELDHAYRTGNVAGFMEMMDTQQAAFRADLEGRQEFMDFFAEMMIESQGSAYGFIAEVGQAAFSSISRNISAMIMGAKDASQAIKDMGKALVGAVVNYVIELIVANVISKALMSAQQAISTTMAAAVAAAWAPAAAMVSLATFGANAGPAMAGIGATVAFSQALAGVTALADGGIVTSPTLALIGEGSSAEAVIPLDRMGDMGFGGGSLSIETLVVQTAATNAAELVDELIPELQRRWNSASRSS